MAELEPMGLPAGPMFETDGIRRVWGDAPLDEHNMPLVGRALGSHLAESGGRVLLAHDQRDVNVPATALIAEGLNDVGVDVVYVGDMPTAGLAYSTMQGEVDFGVMLSASHNGPDYTGVKTFRPDGRKLTDDEQHAIEAKIRAGVDTRGARGSFDHDSSYVDLYEDFLVGSAGGERFDGWRLAVDTAHGAASGIAGRVMARLGFNVTEIGNQPNGSNINDGCGIMHPERLRKTVVEQEHDAGEGHDGDADRVGIFGPNGEFFDGDYIMYVLGSVLKLDGLVATDMTNLGVEEAMTANGLHVVRAGVGDRQVIAGLEQTGYKLGGEQSGHIILPDFLPTGDGMLAAIQFYKAVKQSGRSMAEWHSDITPYPQKLINFELPQDRKHLLRGPEVAAFTEQVKERLGNALVSIRPSGTEPVGRVMIQSRNAEEDAAQVTAELQELLGTLVAA